ncbi:hypothetical protein DCS_04952 [Drechmeria coniospora]|uniref:Uncharacterized protein n=1 Tax=Drechmeria coniospora TaxID=98403 RepID=A0A151GLG0_DRECN|nr:hypothetical protein DCS_04952 [Drechmeria coniospora]KYK57939.1 hypothetical protein DCS_04952 [Drechmeria coniospora]
MARWIVSINATAVAMASGAAVPSLATFANTTFANVDEPTNDGGSVDMAQYLDSDRISRVDGGLIVDNPFSVTGQGYSGH